MKKSDFVFSEKPEPHRIRTKQILKQHPQIRKLIGKNRITFLVIVLLVLAQISLSLLVSSWPWWLVIVFAYCAGAYIDHALFVMIHECTHRLVFKNQSANRLAGML